MMDRAQPQPWDNKGNHRHGVRWTQCFPFKQGVTEGYRESKYSDKSPSAVPIRKEAAYCAETIRGSLKQRAMGERGATPF